MNGATSGSASAATHTGELVGVGRAEFHADTVGPPGPADPVYIFASLVKIAVVWHRIVK
jgi:hypothetical protein